MEPKGFGPIRTVDPLHSNERGTPIKKATLSKTAPMARLLSPGEAPYVRIDSWN